jgi:hypothetical protein
MSSVKTQSRYDSSRHLNFISTAPWQSFFKTYTFNGPSPANNFTGSGALSAVLNTSGVAVTATDCPTGRILRTNGKKLYPDAAALDLTAYPDRTPLVGVFDYHSGLSGFIDPNATVFAIYNVDKPIDSLDGTAASGANNHRGMSVYTGGNVTAAGSITMGSGYLNEFRPLIAADTGVLTLTSLDPTVTASYMVGALITQAPATAQALNLPATVDLITALGSTVGATFKFTYMNRSGTNAATLTAASGTTTIIGALAAPAVIATNTAANFVVRLATATTVIVYRV